MISRSIKQLYLYNQLRINYIISGGNTMRKKYELLMNQINEGKYTGREILLAGAVLFLTGMLLGIIFSPRKYQVIGSNNGNGNGNGSGNGNGNDAMAETKKDMWIKK